MNSQWASTCFVSRARAEITVQLGGQRSRHKICAWVLALCPRRSTHSAASSQVACYRLLASSCAVFDGPSAVRCTSQNAVCTHGLCRAWCRRAASPMGLIAAQPCAGYIGAWASLPERNVDAGAGEQRPSPCRRLRQSATSCAAPGRSLRRLLSRLQRQRRWCRTSQLQLRSSRRTALRLPGSSLRQATGCAPRRTAVLTLRRD